MDGGDPAGGSGELARLIDQHGELITADLIREYGVDAREVFIEESGVTPRFLLSLIFRLPAGSDTKAALRGGPQFEGWDMDRYLRVGEINAIRELTNVFISANTPKDKKPKQLGPFPIPHEKPKNKKPKPGSFAFIALDLMGKRKE